MPGYNPFAHPEQRDALTKALDWMRTQHDDMLTLDSYYFGVYCNRNGPNDVASARALLEYVIAHMPPSHPDRLADNDALLMNWVDHTLQALTFPDETGYVGRKGWEERRQYLFAVLDPLLQAGDARRLLGWLNYQPNAMIPPMGLEILGHHMPPNEAVPWLQRARSLLSDSPTTRVSSAVTAAACRNTVGEIDKLVAALQGRPTPIPAAWQSFEITPFPIGAAPAGMALARYL